MKHKFMFITLAVLTIFLLTVAGAAAQDPEVGEGEADLQQPAQLDEGIDPESVPLGEIDLQATEQQSVDGPAPADDISAQANLGTAFTYQGNITDGGTPANGNYDFEFRLFDDVAAGSQVGPAVNQVIAVTDGIFTAQLDFGAVFDGTALYLEIGVRPDGSTDPYTVLSPRQTLTAAPFAFTLRPGADVVGDAGNNSVVEARNTAPTGSTSHGLRGETDSTSSSVAGVYGRVTSTTPGGFSAGVRGVNEGMGGNGIGVWGSQNGNGWGVYGTSVDGRALYGRANGTSAVNYGIFGSTLSNNGYAGFFQNSASTAGGVGLYSLGSTNETPDIVLGGTSPSNDDGRIASNPNLSGSDLYLMSNDAVVVELNDDNNSEDSDFVIQNGDNDTLLNFDDGSELSIYDDTGTETFEIRANEFSNDGAQMVLRKTDGTSTIILDAEVGAGGDGRIYTEELQITGGADLSEQFEVESRQADLRPEPGLVVSIDPEQPGQLIVSSRAYERTVAGVISGAGGLKPGLMMGQAGTVADGRFPVALTGRVYVYADASYGTIQPGDLLTTSDTPGHVMKVTDHQQAQGAILGKAMSSLSEDQGLVLILVSLQ